MKQRKGRQKVVRKYGSCRWSRGERRVRRILNRALPYLQLLEILLALLVALKTLG